MSGGSFAWRLWWRRRWWRPAEPDSRNAQPCPTPPALSSRLSEPRAPPLVATARGRPDGRTEGQRQADPWRSQRSQAETDSLRHRRACAHRPLRRGESGAREPPATRVAIIWSAASGLPRAFAVSRSLPGLRPALESARRKGSEALLRFPHGI